MPVLFPRSFSASTCSPGSATCARCLFHTFTTSSSGVSGVRIVKMIYGASCWPGGKSDHSPGQNTPHFTPATPSQVQCRLSLSFKDKHCFLSGFPLSVCYYVCHSTTSCSITNLSLPPAASRAYHRGNALPKPVVWPRGKPGKDKTS